MYKRIRSRDKGFFAFIVILAAVFTVIYANYVYAYDSKYRSEEEILDDVRDRIARHLKEPEEIPIEKPAAVEEKPIQIVEEKPIPAVEEEEPVTQISMPADTRTSGVKKPVGEEADFMSGLKKPFATTPVEEPVLKKMDVNKIGASPYYDTYEGLRLLKYFTVAQRVEIYQEPRPIDSYILDAFSMRYLYNNTPWNIKSDYRTQIVPIFTRAYGTELTMSDPKNKEGQLRYTHDYREIYKNYFPKYQYSEGATQTYLKKEMWDQNEILLMHSKIIDPIDWLYTSNIGYRYSTMSAKSDQSYYEVRHTYFGSLSLAPNERLEWFGQGEYYKSMHLKAGYDYRPDHFLGRTEVRIRSKDMTTMFVPQFSYSKDVYYPFADSFEKYEIAFRVGRDFTNKFSATSTLKFVYSYRDEPDNKAPTYVGKNPHKDKAEYIALENRFSYNIYDRLYVQLGLDLANGLNWSIFDNWGILGGIEYYAPGLIRVDVGWRGNHYYNLADYLSSVYFKFYLFM